MSRESGFSDCGLAHEAAKSELLSVRQSLVVAS